MAKHVWKDGLGTGNIQTAGNYADGIAPGAGGEIILDNYAGHINAGLAWAAGPANLSLTFGPNWKGKIGSVSSRLELNTSTGRVRVMSPNTGAVYIGGAVWTIGVIEMHVCSLDPGSPFYFYDGEAARMAVIGPGNSILGASFDIGTELIVGSKFSDGNKAQLMIESGADIEALRIWAGLVNNYANLKTIYGEGGTIEHYGSESGNTGNISVAAQIRTGCHLRWRAGRQAAGFTLAKLEMLGGRFTGTDTNWPNVATLVELHEGQALFDPQWTVATLRKSPISANAIYEGPTPGAGEAIIVPGGK